MINLQKSTELKGFSIIIVIMNHMLAWQNYTGGGTNSSGYYCPYK